MRHFDPASHAADYLCGMLRDRGLPDPATDVPCCEAVAYIGPSACLCWEPVYRDASQAAPVEGLQPASRADRGLCSTCAYRPGSPERSGDEHARYDADDLDVLIHSGNTFHCHEGARVRIGWRHPATGQVVMDETTAGDGRDLAYDPPIIDGTPYKLDGTPLDVCAGFEARREWLARRAAAERADRPA